MNALRRTAVSMVLAATAFTAQAGRSCEPQRPDAGKIVQAMTLADHVKTMLDASGAQVVVLARIGQDLSKYGQRYSHLGLAYRDGNTWRIAHKLNECGTAHAAVFRQGLGEFFLDDLFEFQAGVAVLSPPVQQKLLPVLRDNARLAQLNTPNYSMVAYPWAQVYQQSNQWALETLAMSQDPYATTREGAQSWLRAQGYQPTTLHLSAFQRLGARMTAANVSFDDHPNGKRFTDRIETVTVDSVFTWLQRSALAQAPVAVR
ncbi:DUF2145 domain-containing protein [Piscinibacter terrae]|nr:DUF2145 domain-containing protein [Albitalea terrae]